MSSTQPQSLTRQTPRIRRVLAAGIVAGIVLQVVETLTWPPGSDGDGAAMLRAVGAHPGQHVVASLLEMFSWLAIAPGLLAVVALVRGRGRVLTRVGGWYVAFAICTVGAFVSPTLNVVSVVLGQERDAATATRIWASLTSQPLLVAYVVVLIGISLGMLVLALGLWRGGVVGWWYPVLAVVAGVTEGRTDAGPLLERLLFDLPTIAMVACLAWFLTRVEGQRTDAREPADARTGAVVSA